MERFTNKSPGALTMEQAIARHKKSIAEYRRQARHARELAAQGRGGDTEIAHVTPGEIVLPKALQTPTVLGAIHQAAMDAGIPVDQLRVGSTLNSINPQTGQPEFFDLSKGLYDMRDHGAQMEDSDKWVPRFLQNKPPGYMPTQAELDSLPAAQRERYAEYYEGTGAGMDVLANGVPGLGRLFGQAGKWISRGLGQVAGQDAATREEIAKAYRSGMSPRK